MQLIKISSDKETDQFIIVYSSDLQDCMFSIERFAQERNTPKIRGNNPPIKRELSFSVYGECEFQGYGTNGIVNFKAEIVQYRTWDAEGCSFLD